MQGQNHGQLCHSHPFLGLLCAAAHVTIVCLFAAQCFCVANVSQTVGNRCILRHIDRKVKKIFTFALKHITDGGDVSVTRLKFAAIPQCHLCKVKTGLSMVECWRGGGLGSGLKCGWEREVVGGFVFFCRIQGAHTYWALGC